MKGIIAKKADKTYFVDDGSGVSGELEIHDSDTDYSYLTVRVERNELKVLSAFIDIAANTKKGASKVSEFLRHVADIVDENSVKLRDD